MVGAALDRNGLRPCRYAMTEDGLVVAGSEAGLVDLDPETVVHSGRLGPGEMLVVDLVDGNVFENDELLDLFDKSAPYATMLDRVAFEPEPTVGVMAAEEVLGLQRGFGYTREDVKMVLAPMAADGKDSVWSMGDDAPLAFLAKSPRPVYGYFRQRFAQVTNPAIDPLREAVVVSLHTRLGPWSHMLDKNSPLAGISLPSPYLSLDQVAALRRGEFPHAEELRVGELACLFGLGETLEEGLARVCEEACELVRGGAGILLLTDRGAGSLGIYGTGGTQVSEARPGAPGFGAGAAGTHSRLGETQVSEARPGAPGFGAGAAGTHSRLGETQVSEARPGAPGFGAGAAGTHSRLGETQVSEARPGAPGFGAGAAGTHSRLGETQVSDSRPGAPGFGAGAAGTHSRLGETQVSDSRPGAPGFGAGAAGTHSRLGETQVSDSRPGAPGLGGDQGKAVLPIPMAMATGAVHRALVQAGLRTECGMAVEAGDCRDIHHAAILIGYGAGAVCPWLALETARIAGGDDALGAERRMLKSFDAGLAKVMSKMGISVVDSYRGAHLFDILGLDKQVVEACFTGTPAPLGGIGFGEVERAVRASWSGEAAGDLPDYGWVRFRKAEGAEPHEWQPPTVRALQTAFGSTKAGVKPVDAGAAFKIYSDELTSREPAVLRDLLGIRRAGAALRVEDVESVRSLQRRFVSSAMSLGSLSPEAHTCVTIAMNLLGGRSNTGEGGEDREVYRVVSPGVDGGGGPTHRDEAAMHGARVLVGVGGSAGASANASAKADPFGMTNKRAIASASATADPFGMTTKEAMADTLDAGLRNNRIKQVASGRFGVTAEYLAHAEEIEIKVAQGAKPGEGGQLPGHKVSGLIARLRHAQPGVSLISPPPHHDIYSIEDLAQLIYDLKRVNPRAAVGVKLVSGCGVGTVAAGVAKAYADFIVIAGNTGGTGAAALSSIKYAGNPWELGLAEAQQVLMANGMRGRVRLRTDGGLATAQDVLIAALLGADEYAFGTAVLVSMGCDMARQCHLNTCPVGIATQRPELRAKFRGKPEHVVGFFDEIGADLRRLLARFGLASIESAVGRVDLLEQVRQHGGLDLAPMLKQVSTGARSWGGRRNDQPVEHAPLDEAWVAPALEAIARGEAYRVTAAIANRDRAVGARLGGEIGLLRAQAEVRVDVTFNLAGTAGQSFGAFAVEGMRLVLVGQANDFVGKGLSGGEIVIRAMGRAARESGRHVILGNVALYGATAGSLYAAGRAGERFAVRNSGVTAVVEGVGDHGCEYMTGGTVVVLERAGINFAAGMTGGVAWVFDEDGSFVRDVRFHPEFVDVAGYGEVEMEAREGLRELVARQAEVAGSGLAAGMLTDWDEVAGRFVRLLPRAQV